MSKKAPRKKRKQLGLGAIELLIVVLVIAIIAVLALPQILSSRQLSKFTNVQKQVVSVLREARQEAMSQQNPITFRFNNAEKTVTLSGGNFGKMGDSKNRVIQLNEEGLSPNEIIYGRPAGASGAKLGDGTNLTELTDNVVEITFSTDGSVIDEAKNPQNKAIFFYSSKASAEAAFAVSILGEGGRAKVWRFNPGTNGFIE
jgi:Tfp pilus assembly protein FimT